jgi:uncharacterized membrane protein YdjX (TVP38/TMEM64 family)
MPKLSGQMKLVHGVRLGLALGLVGVALLVLLATPLGAQLWDWLQDPSIERLRRLLAATTVWLPLVIVGLMVLHTLVPVPAEILAFAAGMALGPVWGVVTIWVGAMLGAYFGFFLARTFGQPLVRRLVAPQHLERAQRWVERVDIPILLAVRLIPVLSFNLINVALGLTRISWWRFTWTTGVGIVPLTVFMVVFGAYLDDWRILALITLAVLLVCLGGYGVLRWRHSAFRPRHISHQQEDHEGHRSS